MLAPIVASASPSADVTATRRLARWLGRLCLLLPIALDAQPIAIVRAGATRRVLVAPAAKVSIPLLVDMSAGDGVSLSSLTTELRWSVAALQFDSIRAVGSWTMVANTASASAGSLTVSVLETTGTATTATVAMLYFSASATPAGGTLIVRPSVAGGSGGTPIISAVRTPDADVCVRGSGKWGDVTDDTLVNIIDAQQVARYSVGLSATSSVALRGDVTADGLVNIIDAQQIARFSVGLSAAARISTLLSSPPIVASLTSPSVIDAAAGAERPGVNVSLNEFGIGRQGIFRAVATDASNAVVTPCATLTFATSNPGVATVSAEGLITAIAAGTATITASAGAATTSVSLTVPPAPAARTSVSAAEGFACALNEAGRAYCWGANDQGQLGDGEIANRSFPLEVSGGLTFKQISAGGFSACALTRAGAAYCWGQGTYGQLGNGGTAARQTAPAPVAGGLTFSEISVGYSFACALTTAGSAYCWGLSHAPYVAADTVYTVQTYVPTPVPGGLTFVSIGAGLENACGRTAAGALHCWGNNRLNTLGVSGLLGSRNPVAVSGGLSFSQWDQGMAITCGVATSGQSYCWGRFWARADGTGATAEVGSLPVPTALAGGVPFAAVAPSRGNNIWSANCALAVDGAAYCWGANQYGQVGATTSGTCSVGAETLGPCSGTPTQVSTPVRFKVLATGQTASCGITTANALYCWGRNNFGQLGDGTSSDRMTPGLVLGRLRVP